MPPEPSGLGPYKSLSQELRTEAEHLHSPPTYWRDLFLKAAKHIEDMRSYALSLREREGMVEERWFDGGVTVNANQLREAIEFLGGDEETNVTLKHLTAEQAEDGEGVYVWCEDYPEEGVTKLAAAPSAGGEKGEG
jgi:hypothetical protein